MILVDGKYLSVSVAVIKQHDQKLLEERVYFLLQLSGHSPLGEAKAGDSP